MTREQSAMGRSQVNRNRFTSSCNHDSVDGRQLEAQKSTSSIASGKLLNLLAQRPEAANSLNATPRAFMRLFTGENFGKQLVKIADAAA
jgi:NADPH-dependent curcumin reductase CurA